MCDIWHFCGFFPLKWVNNKMCIQCVLVIPMPMPMIVCIFSLIFFLSSTASVRSFLFPCESLVAHIQIQIYLNRIILHLFNISIKSRCTEFHDFQNHRIESEIVSLIFRHTIIITVLNFFFWNFYRKNKNCYKYTIPSSASVFIFLRCSI